MKVMHFIHGFSTGGAETLVKDYVLKINKNKFDIVVLCFEHHDNSPYDKLLKENNIRVIFINDYLRFKKNNCRIIRLYKYIHRHLLVKKFIKQENPDVLHTHLNVNSYVKRAKVKKNCRIFQTVHSEPKALWSGTRKKTQDFNCAKYLVKHNNMMFIALHDEMRKKINRLFNINNTIVLNNGIDFTRFDKSIVKNKKSVKTNLSIPINSFVVGHIGRFNEVKNHTFIVDVFYEIYNKNSNAFLLLVGDGKVKKDIENKLNGLGLKNNYLILSNRSDIPDLLGIMDIFIFPSLYEGLGIVLIEAQKMNLPCFISDKIPAAAVISNLVTRISLDKSSKEWSDIITNYDYPKRIILNDKDWNIDEIVKKLENIYLEKN